MNENSEENIQFKVLFLGRHGQGWHNVAESKYGTAAWDVRRACNLTFSTDNLEVLLVNARRRRRNNLV